MPERAPHGKRKIANGTISITYATPDPPGERLHGNDPAILADFGLEPITRKAPTAKVAAEAVLQRAQTRVLRHTTGSKQRLEIKAAPATAAPTTTPTPKP